MEEIGECDLGIFREYDCEGVTAAEFVEVRVLLHESERFESIDPSVGVRLIAVTQEREWTKGQGCLHWSDLRLYSSERAKESTISHEEHQVIDLC